MCDDLRSQQSTCCSESTATKLQLDNNGNPPNNEEKEKGRTDQGRIHVMRDSIQSRRLLETLTHYGENARKLRQLEAGYRSDLRPKGPLGRLFFDRFWLCILRLLLLGHLEAQGLTPSEGFMPLLVTEDGPDHSFAMSAEVEGPKPDLFHRLVLIARYDRAVSREMFRYLSLLILMRDGGEKGLTSAIRAVAGIKAGEGISCA